jgi:hypothetical protein
MERWRYEPNYHRGKSVDRGRLCLPLLTVSLLGTGLVTAILCHNRRLISTPCHLVVARYLDAPRK